MQICKSIVAKCYFFNQILLRNILCRYGLHYNDILMMSVLQEVKGLTKEYFPGGRPVSCGISDSLFTRFTCFDIGMAYIIMGMIITSFSSSKRVKKIICLCTRLEENLFTCKISSSLELWLVRFVFQKKMKNR